MNDDNDFLIELQDDFLREVTDLLTPIEESFMRLENDPNNENELAKVFRLFHNLKGTASAVGFDSLAELCHTTENLLNLIRSGKIATSPEIIEMLLKANDTVLVTVNALKKNKAQKFDHSEIKAELKRFIDGEGIPVQKAITNIVEIEIDEKLIKDFLIDASEQLENIDSGLIFLEHSPEELLILDAVFRGFHTLKSGSSIMGFVEIEKVAHLLESILSDIRESKKEFPADKSAICIDGAALIRKMIIEVQNNNYKNLYKYNNEIKKLSMKINGAVNDAVVAAPTVNENTENNSPTGSTALRDGFKVDADKLDKLIDSIGELVISQTLVSQSPDMKIFTSSQAITKDLDRLGKITRNLQEIGMSLRMVPIRQTFKKMNRLVRDLSKKLDKEITLVTIGDETELDKTVADKIGDPLVHMVRNSLDHGIEKKGTITLRAYHKGGSICLEIKDDGRGLNPEKLLSKAREKGLIGKDEKLTLSETYALIFRAGFSMAAQVTDVSGRGVGMDVVRRNIEEIHGQIEIDSEVGKGTTFTIKIPNTLAIIEGMLLVVGGERYVMPTYSIIRSTNPIKKEIITSGGGRTEMFNLEGEVIPLVRLGRIYNIEAAESDPCRAIILLLEDSGKKIAILVDQIIRQQQFVVKPLTGIMSNVPGVSGGTIMPDGQVGLILDAGLLIQHVKEKYTYIKQGDYQSGE
jgi:two-component system chemotaxis sensor kinase CheA